MTANLWCSPQVHFAAVDDDIVVLDVARDRYHCLLDAAGSLRLGSDGALMADDEALATELRAAGFAACAPPEAKRADLISPRRELAMSLKPTVAALLRTAMVWITASLIYRRKAFPALVVHHLDLRGRLPERDEGRISEIIGAARLVRPWIPFEGQCLQQAFQLRCVLASRGVEVDWIFGVRTWPFSAHCWLQIDDVVVGDRLSRVNRYTPIMRT